MKQAEYLEGHKAMENFEEGMKALFKVPKDLTSSRPAARLPRASSSAHPFPMAELSG
jgi:hypothetical protein